MAADHTVRAQPLVILQSLAAGVLLLALQGVCADEPQAIKVATKESVTGICITPDGTRIAVGCSDPGNVQIIDIGTGREDFVLAGQDGPVQGLAVSPDGGLVAAGNVWVKAGESEIGTVVWDFRTRKLKFRVGGHKLQISALAFSPDGNLLAAGDGDGIVEILDAVKGVKLATLGGHLAEISRITFTPDGALLATASDDHDIRLWDVAARKACAVLSTKEVGTISALAFSPDGTRLLAADNIDSGVVRTWDVKTHKQLAIVRLNDKPFVVVSCLGLSSDLKWVVTGGEDGTVKVWSVETGKEAAAFSLGKFMSVTDVAFTPDGGRLVAGAKDESPPSFGPGRSKYGLPPYGGMVACWDITKWIGSKGTSKSGQ